MKSHAMRSHDPSLTSNIPHETPGDFHDLVADTAVETLADDLTHHLDGAQVAYSYLLVLLNLTRQRVEKKYPDALNELVLLIDADYRQ